MIVSLDADFLASDGAFNLHYMRQFATRRRVEENADNLSRLYVVESNHTVTGGRADNRLPLKSSQIESFARAVAAASGVAGISGTAPAGSEAFVDAVAKDLAAHRGRAVVIAGDAMPPAVHAIAHAINAALGAPVTYLPTPEIVPSEQHAALRELVAEINAGQVQMLLIIGESNPVFSAPADSQLRRRRSARWRCAFTRDCSSTRRPPSANGTFRRRTTSKRGATRGRSTARCRSCSR